MEIEVTYNKLKDLMDSSDKDRDRKYEDNPTLLAENIEGALDFLVTLMPEETTLSGWKLLVVVSKSFRDGVVHLNRELADVLKCSPRTYYIALNQLLDAGVIFRSTDPSKFWINQGQLKPNEDATGTAVDVL